MRVSVILCTYSPEMYAHFLEAAESVLTQTYDEVELVVIVDGSADVYEQAVHDLGDREEVIIHRNDENRGLLASRNTGADLAHGDVIAFIDADAVADEGWVEALVEGYRQGGVVAVGGKMTPNWVAGKPSFLPEEFYWLVGVTHRGFADGSGEVRNTNGSNISFRRDVFLDLGGFDTTIGGRRGEKNLQGGETELCARMEKQYGEGVWYTPEATVAHKVFEYRTDPVWLLDRAFWQGYSKRGMDVLVPDSISEEREFLSRLVAEYLPSRLAELLTGPSIPKVEQLVMLFALTGAVGLGYLYGCLKWR